MKYDYYKLADQVRMFEDTAGIKISGWLDQNIGNAVKQVLEGKHLKSIETIKKMRVRAVNLVKYLDDEVSHYHTL